MARFIPLLVLAAACSSDSSNSPDPRTSTKWILNTITVPTSLSQANLLAFDLNGDGTADNALGGVLSALGTLVSVDLQSSMNSAIASGEVVQLIDVQSRDATLTTDASATASWEIGLATAGYTAGPHQVNGAYTPGVTAGTITNHDYVSVNPATTAHPVAAYLPLRLFASTATFYLPINGARLRGHFSGTSDIASGQFNGSIRQQDVANLLVPYLAQSFNDEIQADTSSATAHNIEAAFDNGGCPGGVADDKSISVCEVATHPILQTLLSADVQIYGAGGNYNPSAANTTPNALSFGFGFTAVRTSF